MDARVMVQRFLLKFAHVCVREIVQTSASSRLTECSLNEILSTIHIFIKLKYGFYQILHGRARTMCRIIVILSLSVPSTREYIYRTKQYPFTKSYFQLTIVLAEANPLTECPWVGFELSHCCHKSKEQSFSECKCVRSILTC